MGGGPSTSCDRGFQQCGCSGHASSGMSARGLCGAASREPRAYPRPRLIPAPSFSGLTEDGLPGPGGQTHPRLRAPDHRGRGGAALAGAGREARQGVQAADGRVRVPPPGQERGGRQ